MYYPRFTKVIIYYFLTQDKTLYWRNKIGMHTSMDDYLINTLRFVFPKEETQIYGAILPESLTSPEMKETKAYKTYLGFTTGATPPKKAVKRPVKKSTKAPARGVVIRETPEMPLFKKKEKVDVTRGKGIELLSKVALAKDTQFEEVRRKSMRDFHKTHLSGSGNDEDHNNNEQNSSGEDSDQENDSDDDKTQSDNENESNSKHETDENESGSESDLEENEEDIGDDEDETKITDKAEVDTDKGFIQEEGTNAEITNIQQGNKNSGISQVIEDALVTISTVPQKTKVHTKPVNTTLLTIPVSVITDSTQVYSIVIPQSSPSCTPPPQQSTSTPPPTTKATNPQSAFPNFTSIFQLNNRVTTLEKEVAELKKDPLHT
ncbi:hypothetical protein Tco_0070929 [Tanacetum coccineum]